MIIKNWSRILAVVHSEWFQHLFTAEIVEQVVQINGVVSNTWHPRLICDFLIIQDTVSHVILRIFTSLNYLGIIWNKLSSWFGPTVNIKDSSFLEFMLQIFQVMVARLFSIEHDAWIRFDIIVKLLFDVSLLYEFCE